MYTLTTKKEIVKSLLGSLPLEYDFDVSFISLSTSMSNVNYSVHVEPYLVTSNVTKLGSLLPE